MLGTIEFNVRLPVGVVFCSVVVHVLSKTFSHVYVASEDC